MSRLPWKKDGDVVLITHARTIPTTSVDDALLYLIIITGVVVIIFNMENTPSIGESFHINKLLDYLPIIIITVIVLVGFFTWDIIRKQLGSFMMLILVVIYALWVMSADVKTYKEWLKGDANNSILPPSPSSPPTVWHQIGLIVCSVVAVAGIGLGFGSIGINANPPTVPFSDNIGALQSIGGIFSIGGIILVIYSLWKIFRDTDTPDTDADNSSSKKM